MRVLLVLLIWSLGAPALATLTATRGPWPLRPLALTDPRPTPRTEALRHWWRNDQGQYLVGQPNETGGPAQAWALEPPSGARACPSLKPWPAERAHESDWQPWPDSERALPADCLSGLQGQCLSHDGALRLRLSFEGQTRRVAKPAGKTKDPGGVHYTGQRRLVIEHVLSGVQAVFEETLKDSPQYSALGPANVVYLPELGSVVLQGLAPAPPARGTPSALHCLPMP
ncbi:hypothetical protein PSQ40_12955 [Curvibacter sp. HBC61]|uniref:Uncharacterized protein n=1 Tax=Curvibacter cyanobacteriorum TaxID=3026422 RepID=A0ABT5N1E3_9BURK|nr:hypothetical protein [Curvibacter sp. HBC61]MDD0839486.1 hypothetical protein [Curvibacter sp. HBC61]